MSQLLAKKEFEQAANTLHRFASDELNFLKIEKAANILVNCLVAGGKIISCGNGGSHCDAMHFAEELTGRYRKNRRPFPAICISDPSYLSCVSNDFGYDQVFSRFIAAFAKPGDVLLAISSSGNSGSVIKAVDAAVAAEMKILILTGNSGGELQGKGDVLIAVQHEGYADRVQEIHIKVIHVLICLIEYYFDEKKPKGL